MPLKPLPNLVKSLLIFPDAQVIGCSTDSKFSHRQWALQSRKQGGLDPCNIPLLSDITHQISQDYGVYIDHGTDNGVAFRGTFIIDPKGILRQYSVNDLPVGRSVDEVIRLLQAFQHSDKYGEVCPARWKPGKATMIPEVGHSKTEQYWSKEHTAGYYGENNSGKQ
jgi:alkyl hydroperoxide reductase subunit AhpC